MRTNPLSLQEFLEDKLWSDRPDLFIWWDGLESQGHQDRRMGDFHRFTRELIWLRRHHPALRSEPINVFHIDEVTRVPAFPRRVPGNPGGISADGPPTRGLPHSAGITLPASSVLVFASDWGD